MLKKLTSLFSSDLAVDISRDHIYVYAKGRGIVVTEPSLFLANKSNNELEAFGTQAQNQLLHSGNVIAIRPIEDGVLTNFDMLVKAFQYYISSVHNGRSWYAPRLVISSPSELALAERYVIAECGYLAGASEVHLVDYPIAAAIGAGLPIFEPHGNMVIHIDHSTTSIAVISYGGVICSYTVRVGVEDMDGAISQYFKSNYDLVISERTIVTIRNELGSAFPLDEPEIMEVRGYLPAKGLSQSINVTDEEIREVLADSFSIIVSAVRIALEPTPPELSADIVERGIVLTGSGALLKNLDRRLSIETGLPVSIAEDPISSVILGVGKLLSNFEHLKRAEWQP
jgi:rod shape-determining protein MreB